MDNVGVANTVKTVLSGPHFKQTPSIKWTPAWILKFSSHIYLNQMKTVRLGINNVLIEECQ